MTAIPEKYKKAQGSPSLWLPTEPGETLEGSYAIRVVTCYDVTKKAKTLAPRPTVVTADGKVHVLPDHYLLLEQLREVDALLAEGETAPVYLVYEGPGEREGQGGKPLVEWTVGYLL